MKGTTMTNRTRHGTEAELRMLFEQAVRAIGFYEAQRKEVLMAIEGLRRALDASRPTANAIHVAEL
jgi:hypothetical protein